MKLVLERVQSSAGVFTLDVDLTLSSRAVGLFGDSGAGKTTLLELIAGLRRPQSGIIRLDDQVLDNPSHRIHVAPEARGIGYLPQDGALFPHLSVRKNLDYGRRRPREARRSTLTLEATLDALDIADLLDRHVSGLSGGERQRVALARALLASPRLLLLDEPLSSLDDAHKRAILPCLTRIRDEFGVPLLYVSHAADELFALCDHIVVLHRGTVRSSGPPNTVFEKVTLTGHRLVHRSPL
ncbi:MAG: ATP-binding cassette domain-containing protein [Opitutaceae bacterium]|nr:ATP-binding cassette domain-containing protein [Opitutaceae bacterium]